MASSTQGSVFVVWSKRLLYALLFAQLFPSSLFARESDFVPTEKSGQFEEFPENLPEKFAKEPVQDASKEKGLSPDKLRSQTEWFAFRLGGGEYMISLELLAPTLRWKHIYFTTLSIGANPSWMFMPYDDIFWHVGPTVGYPFHLGNSGKHEIRLGVGLHAGGTDNSSRTVEKACDLEPQHTSFSLGLNLFPEILYQYRVESHLAFSAGIKAMIPVGPRIECYPHPPVIFFMGMAF